jgi:hypothetical protein
MLGVALEANEKLQADPQLMEVAPDSIIRTAWLPEQAGVKTTAVPGV